MDRVILHSDLNNFYASVECMRDPALRNVPVAVCGNQEERHGIVLAKNELAKMKGVQTGEVIWQAKQKCPGLVIVPPRFGEYLRISEIVKQIYYRFTDQVESYGIDECWLDVTGSTHLFGPGPAIAESIRQAVKDELNLTVSVGVSFNKVTAKLGSDMKKPDAVTVITREDFREKVWPLPARDLLYVGPATERKIRDVGIETIGDIARAHPDMLKCLLGVNGLILWRFARGEDNSRVCAFDYAAPVKSIGHGITCTSDLVNDFEVRQVITELSQGVSHRLRVHNLAATGIQISIRDCSLWTREHQTRLPYITQSAREITEGAYSLFVERYAWGRPVRSLTVRAINLVPGDMPRQVDMLEDAAARDRLERLELAIEDIRQRYGKQAIRIASVMRGLKMPAGDAHEMMTLPGCMHQ